MLTNYCNKMTNDLHIGKVIKQKLKEQDRSIAWLAKQLSYDRGNLSRILQYTDIHSSVLRRITKILNYDFFKHFSASACGGP